MRYRRVSARFLRSPVGRPLRPEPIWDVTFLSLAPRTWRPPIDVCETAEGLVVVVEIAGVDDDEVEVTLFADALIVEGDRRLDPCGADGRYDRAEIRQGPFRVELGLPFPVDADRVEANYERGLLRISLPRPRPSTHRSSSGRPAGATDRPTGRRRRRTG